MRVDRGEVPLDLANLVVEDAAAGLYRVHRSALTSTGILRLATTGAAWSPGAR